MNITRSSAIAGLLLLAALLLASAAAFDAAASETPAPARLEMKRLFAGALAVQSAPPGSGPMLQMRGAAFADTTELRWMRFADAAAAARQLARLADGLGGEPVQLGSHRGWHLARAASRERFVYVERHGNALVELRARDAAQAQQRMDAQGLPAAEADDADAVAPTPWLAGAGLLLPIAGTAGLLLCWLGAAGRQPRKRSAQ